MESNLRLWWGYLHTSGTLQVKPYFSELDIQDALESPFCKHIMHPVKVGSREEALAKLQEIVDNLPLENIKKSGFFDLEEYKICNHPEHNPPTHLYIPQGKGYKHICPGCGAVQTIIPPQISFKLNKSNDFPKL